MKLCVCNKCYFPTCIYETVYSCILYSSCVFIIIQSVIWPGLSTDIADIMNVCFKLMRFHNNTICGFPLTSLIIIMKGFVKNQETNNTTVIIGGY